MPTATTLPWWRKSPEARPREPLLCHQLRALFFTSAHFDFELIAQHNPGRDNSLADALSRDDLHSFFVQVPSADHAPTPVPVALQVRLSKAQPFWKSPDWRDWYSHALALSTPRTYASAQTRYLHFCSSINIPALPVNEQCLYQFVVLLATQRVAHASLKGYQSALRHLLILSLGADPNISDMVVLHYFLQGIKRAQAAARPGATRIRLPITVDIMRLLKEAQEGASFNTSMLWATACACFCAPGKQRYNPHPRTTLTYICPSWTCQWTRVCSLRR